MTTSFRPLSSAGAAFALLSLFCAGQRITAAPTNEYQLFARSNLVAWCIVPFDAKKRSPEQRAAMLEEMKIKRLAYDYRAEHIPTFDAEMDALQRHGIELTAWWFPGELNDEARLILDVLRRHNLKPQLWVTGAGGPTTTPEEQTARVEAEIKRLQPIVAAAAAQGCQVALYNHGNWFGEPENQLAIIESLRKAGHTNVGLVYNLHHGHEHLDRFAALMSRMKPRLLALNLNGMTRGGDQHGRKIMPLGQGDLDLTLLRTIEQSGWHGPIGILNHTDEDAQARLLDNLEGLDWLIHQMDGTAPAPKPKPRSWKPPPDGARVSPPAPSLGGPTGDAYVAFALPRAKVKDQPARRSPTHGGRKVGLPAAVPRGRDEGGLPEPVQ